jgi:hypothetical protein
MPTKHAERLCLRAILLLSRAKWRLRKQLAAERRAFVQTAPRRLATFVILERLRRLVADSASFPAHHSWGLVFACQSVARSHQAFAKGPWT